MNSISESQTISACMEPFIEAERDRASKEALGVVLKHYKKALKELLDFAPNGFKDLTCRIVESDLRVSTRSDDRLPEVEFSKPDGTTFRLNQYAEESDEADFLHWATGNPDLDADQAFEDLVRESEVPDELDLATLFLAVAAIEHADTDNLLFSEYERTVSEDQSTAKIAGTIALPGTHHRALHLSVTVNSDTGNIEFTEAYIFGLNTAPCQVRLKQGEDPFASIGKPGADLCQRTFDLADVVGRVSGELTDDLISLAATHASKYRFGEAFDFEGAYSTIDPLSNRDAQWMIFSNLEPGEFGAFLNGPHGPVIASDPYFRSQMPFKPDLPSGTSAYDYPPVLRDYFAPLWGNRINLSFGPEDTELYVRSLFAMGVPADRAGDIVSALEQPDRRANAQTMEARLAAAKALRDNPESFIHEAPDRDERLDKEGWFSDLLASRVSFPSAAELRERYLADQYRATALSSGQYQSAVGDLSEMLNTLRDPDEPISVDARLIEQLTLGTENRGLLNGLDLTDDERYFLAKRLLSEAEFVCFTSHNDDDVLTQDQMDLSLPNGDTLRVSIQYDIEHFCDEGGPGVEILGIERIDIDQVRAGEVVVLEDNDLINVHDCELSDLRDAFSDLLTISSDFTIPDPEVFEPVISQHLAAVSKRSLKNALRARLSTEKGSAPPTIEQLAEGDPIMRSLKERSSFDHAHVVQELKDNPDLWVPIAHVCVKRAYSHFLSDKALNETDSFCHPYQVWSRRLKEFYNLPLDEMTKDLCHLASRDLPFTDGFKNSVQSALDSATLSNENKAQLRAALLHVKQERLGVARPVEPAPTVSRGL